MRLGFRGRLVRLCFQGASDAEIAACEVRERSGRGWSTGLLEELEQLTEHARPNHRGLRSAFRGACNFLRGAEHHRTTGSHGYGFDRIGVWSSDVVCPWCFIGKRRLEKALALAGRKGEHVRWKAFELNPQSPKEGMDRQAYRARKFGSADYAKELEARVIEAGAEEGIDFLLRPSRIERAFPTPSMRTA